MGGMSFSNIFLLSPHTTILTGMENSGIRFKSEPSPYQISKCLWHFLSDKHEHIAYPPPIKGVAVVGFPLTSTKVRNLKNNKGKIE